MSSPLKVRGLMLIAAALTVMYTAHVTLSTLYRFQTDCQEVAAGQPIDRQRFYAIATDVEATAGEAKRGQIWAPDPLASLNRTDYFGCSDFDKIPKTTQAIKENTKGNRGISFIKVRINGITTSAVFKEANKYPLTPANTYKYNTAKREIEFLNRLKGLRGVPHIYGSCVNETTVRYIVERIKGFTICNDNGTTVNCSESHFILGEIGKDENPGLAALKLALSTVQMFRLLEERHLFFEDISGVNLMVTKEWQLYLADADSLVFFNDSRLFSKLTCSSDQHCPGPTGNLWIYNSLNARIYDGCKEMLGICDMGRCRGFDTMLHVCGMARWYICDLSRFFDDVPEVQRGFEKMCTCMKQPLPQHRCSFLEATKHFASLLETYIEGGDRSH